MMSLDVLFRINVSRPGLEGAHFNNLVSLSFPVFSELFHQAPKLLMNELGIPALSLALVNSAWTISEGGIGAPEEEEVVVGSLVMVASDEVEEMRDSRREEVVDDGLEG